MEKVIFDLYLKEFIDIHDNTFNNINHILEKSKNIMPYIRIYIYGLNCYRNDFSKEELISIDNLLNTLKYDKNIYNYDSNYIEKNYRDCYESLKSKKIKNFVIYPYNIGDKSYGYIYVDNNENIDEFKKIIDLIIFMLTKSIEKMYYIKNNGNYNEVTNFYEEIKEGIKLNEFKLVYQPKFNMKSNKVIGAEVLIRWNKSDGNVIYPDKFVEKLENENLIYLIDYYMIEQSLKKLHQWSNLMNGNIVPISINLSKSTLMRLDFIDTLKSFIEKYNIDLKYLEFEITEREYVDFSIQEINDKVGIVRDLGIKVSLDDFGSGHSNLSFSMNINLDSIKIDKSIINQVGKNEKINYLLKFLLELANNYNIGLVAEGIETKEQVEFLINSGYELGQGYYFSRPIDVDLFEREYLIV